MYLGLFIWKMIVASGSRKNQVKLIIVVVSSVVKGKVCLWIYFLLFRTRRGTNLRLIEQMIR